MPALVKRFKFTPILGALLKQSLNLQRKSILSLFFLPSPSVDSSGYHAPPSGSVEWLKTKEHSEGKNPGSKP